MEYIYNTQEAHAMAKLVSDEDGGLQASTGTVLNISQMFS